METFEFYYFVKKAHGDQQYGALPYVCHLNDVATMSYHRGNDTLYAKVAYGHDLLEDTDVTAQQLQDLGVDSRIIDAIVALTKVNGESYKTYLDKVAANPIALEIKKCDTMCNLIQSFKEGNNYRILKYTKQLKELEKRGASNETPPYWR